MDRTPAAVTSYDVIGYDLRITCLPVQSEIQAEMEIRFVVVEDITNCLYFDFSGMIIDSVLHENQLVEATLNGETLEICPAATITAGDTHSVRIAYHGKPQRGLYFRKNRLNETVIYSHNEPYDAHYWFPCHDSPSDKAILTMTIRIPSEMTAISNGILVRDETDIQQGIRQMEWKESFPITPYLISLAAGKFEAVMQTFSQDSIQFPLVYYVYADDVTRARNALTITGEMIHFYNDYIGAYPFQTEKYAMVEVPLREASAMEHQTATTMGDFIMDNHEVIAHELAHQWWGDAVTPVTFSDIWLNEGFASYYDALFTEYKYGNAAFQVRLDNFRSNMNTDGSLNYPILDPPENYLFGRAVYMKGAWVLHMLREKLGDTVFRRIGRTYFAEYQYGHVRTDDFIRIAETVSGTSLHRFFSQWLEYGGIPVVTGAWRQSDGMVKLNLSQNQAEPLYQFDLEIKVEGLLRDTVFTLAVSGKETEINFRFSDAITGIVLDPANKVLMINNSPLYQHPSRSAFVKIYPNPAFGKINLIYQLERKGAVTITLYDLGGRKIEQVTESVKTAGLHHFEWSSGGVASGIYFWRLVTSEGADVQKMILLK